MTTSPAPPTLTWPHRLLQQLSVPLLGAASAAFAIGVLSGTVVFLNRSPIRQTQLAGTAAWWPHLGLATVAVALLAIARQRRRRAGDDSLLLLALVGASTWERLRLTIHTARLRAALALPTTSTSP
ncbi:MAG: hypothetical protein WAL22_20920 [Solirubrobacteraceae bacterium]